MMYRFGSDPRDGSGGEVVFADTGELHERAGEDMRVRAVAAWTGQPASAVAPDARAVELRQLDQYDRYNLDRTRQQPLPVILALMNDEAHTRYIDPKTASIVGTFSDRTFWRRWLYNGCTR